MKMSYAKKRANEFYTGGLYAEICTDCGEELRYKNFGFVKCNHCKTINYSCDACPIMIDEDLGPCCLSNCPFEKDNYDMGMPVDFAITEVTLDRDKVIKVIEGIDKWRGQAFMGPCETTDYQGDEVYNALLDLSEMIEYYSFK